MRRRRKPKSMWSAVSLSLSLSLSLYKEQLRQCRHFLHERPWSARSWGLPSVQEILNHPSVELVQGHMCRFRMITHTETKYGRRRLVKKPTGFVSSSRCVRQELVNKFTGDHAHVPLVGGRSAGAQVYPQMLEWLDNSGRMHRWDSRLGK